MSFFKEGNHQYLPSSQCRGNWYHDDIAARAKPASIGMVTHGYAGSIAYCGIWQPFEAGVSWLYKRQIIECNWVTPVDIGSRMCCFSGGNALILLINRLPLNPICIIPVGCKAPSNPCPTVTLRMPLFLDCDIKRRKQCTNFSGWANAMKFGPFLHNTYPVIFCFYPYLPMLKHISHWK